jgi:hypothetical protein
MRWGGGGLAGGSGEVFLMLGLLQDGEYLADLALLHAVIVDEVPRCKDQQRDEEEEEELAPGVEAAAPLGLWVQGVLLFLEGAGGLVRIGGESGDFVVGLLLGCLLRRLFGLLVLILHPKD